MKKLLCGLAILALALTLGSLAANAQSTVGMVYLGSDTVSFTPDGGGVVTMKVGSTTGFAAGNNLLSSASGFTLGAGTFTLMEVGSSNTYTSLGTIPLELNGGSLLTGVLDLVSFTQTSFMGSTNTSLMANLDITGGSYCPPSGTGTCGLGSGLVTLNFLLGSSNPIALDPTNGDITGGTLITPPKNIAITPEPGTMLLFGSGLFALGGILRRRMRTA
ncbi:MAG: PEP-CTERM sorting domain-containing protein [Candidatus Acidiferrum sp.]